MFTGLNFSRLTATALFAVDPPQTLRINTVKSMRSKRTEPKKNNTRWELKLETHPHIMRIEAERQHTLWGLDLNGNGF